MNEGKQIGRDFILEWMDKDETFISSYGTLDGEQFCKCVQQRYHEKENVESILVYRAKPGSKRLKPQVALKRTIPKPKRVPEDFSSPHILKQQRASSF